MRINRYLAQSGLCSRRDAEKLVREGRIRINRKIVSDLSTRVQPQDEVEADGAIVRPVQKKVVYAYHKPVGVTVTMEDPQQKNILGDRLKQLPERVVPVGRLDKDSSGLLLLTNDGALVHRLTHPSFEKEKIYLVTLDRMPKKKDLEQFERGVLLDGKMTKRARVKNTPDGLEIRLQEGRNRQIRRMWDALGYQVQTLHRIAMDGIRLGELPQGAFRRLGAEEVRKLG